MSFAHYLRIAFLNGMGVKDALFLPPGIVFDLLELQRRAGKHSDNPEF